MKKFIIVSMAFCVLITASAQLPDAVDKAKTATTTAANPGKLLSQFAGALKTTALLSSFTGQKTGWLAKAGKVSDAVGMAQSVASLAGGIKPEMFKSGFNVSSLVQAAGTVQTLAAAGGLLKNLSGGLKPEAFTSGWTAQKPGWESALGLLK
jgi:pectin methylesterase-like acyl-CoA thioesterase